MDIVIHKVKLKKGGGLALVLDCPLGNSLGESVEKAVFDSDDEPKQSLKDALQALLPHAQHICDMPAGYLSAGEVTGVRFIYEGADERLGAIISIKRVTPGSNSPVVINTPRTSEAVDLDGESDQDHGGAVLTNECLDALALVIIEAKAYLAGERAPKPEQLNMFDGPPDDPDGGEPAPIPSGPKKVKATAKLQVAA